MSSTILRETNTSPIANTLFLLIFSIWPKLEKAYSWLQTSSMFFKFWCDYQSYLDVFISGFLSKNIEKHYVKKLVACLWRNKWTIETNVGLQIKCLKKAPEPQGKVILNDAAESMKLHLKVWLALSKISRWCCSNCSQNALLVAHGEWFADLGIELCCFHTFSEFFFGGGN